jgi:addiction module RelE/StbE family toxin
MEIVWRRTALDDLESIRAFIAHDNPAAAVRVHAAIRKAVDPLAELPHVGRPGRVDGTRELVLAGLPYVVVYRVADSQVRILAVIHASRQWPASFSSR